MCVIFFPFLPFAGSILEMLRFGLALPAALRPTAGHASTLAVGIATAQSTIPLPPACDFNAAPFLPLVGGCGAFGATPTLLYAHWYAGKRLRHRQARERRFHAKLQVSTYGRNNFSRKWYRKTNRWNYVQGIKDMP